MDEKVQSIEYAEGNDIRFKDGCNGGSLHLNHRDSQSCNFEHQAVPV